MKINNKLLATANIDKLGESANFEMRTFNKIFIGLTRKCVEMTNAPYSNR